LGPPFFRIQRDGGPCSLSKERRVIEIDTLTKRYGSICALDRVTFAVADGQIVGLLGPNGAGKTTLVKIATLLTRMDSGTCRLNGFDVTQNPDDIRKIIGVVPQATNLDRDLTAWENLLIYGKLHKVTHLKDRIAGALKSVSLWDRRDAIVSQLSGGMQRRLLLARVLLSEPDVVFLDEPSIGLDPLIRHQIWDIVRAMRHAGRTVLMTTHYIEEAEALCDRVGILMKGRLVVIDAPEALKARVGTHVVEYFDSAGALRHQICRTRADADEVANGVGAGTSIRDASLEDVFLALTNEKLS
jgi:ABC-2 type transport system ATP-binding protein